MKKPLTLQQKNDGIDLIVILAITFVTVIVASLFNTNINAFANNNTYSIILRTLAIALLQFSIAGLGITVVSLYRKQSFKTHGLKKKGTLTAIILTCIAFIPELFVFYMLFNRYSWLPFQQVTVTKYILESNFPINAICFVIVAIAWGFFEGFNYIVISDKVNSRFPSNNIWVNWGAISAAISCILVHGMIGVNMSDILDTLAIAFFIYAMILIKDKTGNAWGAIFVFVFLWNAFK